jgi:hypothetical protein
MTAPVVSAGKPFTLTGAYVELSGTDFTCLTNHLVIKPDVTKETAKSICGSVDYVGQIKWLFGLTLYQSFEDATATYQVLDAAVKAGVAVPFVVRPYPGPAGPANPEFTGMVNPEPFTIFDSDAGALVTTDIEWTCLEEPTVTNTVGGGTQSAAQKPAEKVDANS